MWDAIKIEELRPYFDKLPKTWARSLSDHLTLVGKWADLCAMLHHCRALTSEVCRT